MQESSEIHSVAAVFLVEELWHPLLDAGPAAPVAYWRYPDLKTRPSSLFMLGDGTEF
jgi:hypothetical protein